MVVSLDKVSRYYQEKLVPTMEQARVAALKELKKERRASNCTVESINIFWHEETEMYYTSYASGDGGYEPLETIFLDGTAKVFTPHFIPGYRGFCEGHSYLVVAAGTPGKNGYAIISDPKVKGQRVDTWVRRWAQNGYEVVKYEPLERYAYMRPNGPIWSAQFTSSGWLHVCDRYVSSGESKVESLEGVGEEGGLSG